MYYLREQAIKALARQLEKDFLAIENEQPVKQHPREFIKSLSKNEKLKYLSAFETFTNNDDTLTEICLHQLYLDLRYSWRGYADYSLDGLEAALEGWDLEDINNILEDDRKVLEAA